MNDKNDSMFLSSILLSIEIEKKKFESTNENEISKSNQFAQLSIVTQNFETMFFFIFHDQIFFLNLID